MTYPQPSVARFIADHLIPVRLVLDHPHDQAHFRTHRVIWTPTIVILDRRGVGHYQSPGFLPPAPFLAMLRIGLARALAAWMRYDDAAMLLEAVAGDLANPFAPEALYWLGATWYLKERRRAPMMRAWDRLLQEHAESIWAARVPPNQEAEGEA